MTTYGLYSLTPPPTDPPAIMQRADEVNAVLRMLTDKHTSAVILTGTPGVGKSILAALLYKRVRAAQQAGKSAPKHAVWLRLGTYTTLPDMIAAILQALEVIEPDFFLLRPEQQISTLLRTLRRPGESALVVLDQFELLLHPETQHGVAGRGILQSFLAMLQTELGASRLLLTGYNSPFEESETDDTPARVRPYLVSRISLPEGVTLLQQRGVQGSPDDLSLLWQRCSGHVFALVLYGALTRLSGLSLNYLLTAPDYQPMWSGEVIIHLITAICHFLKPSQYALVRALSLFHEPVPLDGLKMTIMGNSASHATGTEYLADLEKNLDILIQLAIVQQVVNVEGYACYELHALLRLYIQEHYLQGSDLAGMQIPARPTSQNVDPRQAALAAGHMQVASYYLSLRKTRCPPPGERKGPQDVAPIIAAIRHLCLGWRWQRACELLFEEGLHHSMIQWGAWNTLIGLYTALLPPLGVLLRRDEGVIASQVGLLYGRMGERQQSQAYFERALAIQRQIDDTKGEITTLINQGELLRMYGDTEKARENFERALALNEQLTSPDMYRKCILLHNLGLVHHSEKRQKEAFRCYIEALQLTKGERGEQNVGMILTNLGILMYEQGVHREALAILLAAQQLRERRQDAGVSMLEHFLNVLEQRMGEEAYAKMRQEALAIQQEVLSRFISINVRQ